MNRLAVYGWDEDEPRLLDALQRDARFTLAAIGDRHASALVRARAATGRPCYQHALEMFRTARYDAALLASSEGAMQAAQAAANAGAAVLLLGECADGATIIEASEAALRARVPFALMRPRLQQAGLAFLVNLAASDVGWRPRFLDLTLAAPTGATELSRDAIALANRLMQTTPSSVTGTALGDNEFDGCDTVTAEFRYPEVRLASLRARTSTVERVSLFAECPLGELELRAEDGATTLTMSRRDGRRETSRLTDGDLFAAEAQRATRVIAGDASDALFAPRDGGVLLALERSILTGQVALVEEPSSRSHFVLMEGHAVAPSQRLGHLRLVGV